MYLIIKAVVSGVLIALASELARRSSLLGAVLISLPLTSILAMVWLYRDTRDSGQVADLSWSILWVVIPSIVFFVVLPIALKKLDFSWALLVASAATIAAYAVWIWASRRLGLTL